MEKLKISVKYKRYLINFISRLDGYILSDVGPMLTDPRPHFHQLPTWAQRILAIWG